MFKITKIAIKLLCLKNMVRHSRVNKGEFFSLHKRRIIYEMFNKLTLLTVKCVDIISVVMSAVAYVL